MADGMADGTDAEGTPSGQAPGSGNGGATGRPPKRGTRGGPPPPCPDCRGSGKLLLLTSAVPCPRCGGTGSGAAAPPAVPGGSPAGTDTTYIEYGGGGQPDAVVRTSYDREGRLTCITREHLRPPESVTYRYDCGDGGADAAGNGPPAPP